MHMWVVLWVFWTKGGAECPKRFPGPHWPRTIPSNMLPRCHLSGPLTFQTTSQTLFVTLTDLFRLLSHKLGHKSALVSDKGEDEVASSLHRPSNLQLFDSKTRTPTFTWFLSDGCISFLKIFDRLHEARLKTPSQRTLIFWKWFYATQLNFFYWTLD